MAVFANSQQSSIQVTSATTSSSSISMSLTGNNKTNFLSFVNKTINEFMKLNANSSTLNLIEEFVPYYTYRMFLKDQHPIPQLPHAQQRAQEQPINPHSSYQNLHPTQIYEYTIVQSKNPIQQARVQPQLQQLPVKHNLAEVLLQTNCKQIPQLQNPEQNIQAQIPQSQTVKPYIVLVAPAESQISSSQSTQFQSQQTTSTATIQLPSHPNEQDQQPLVKRETSEQPMEQGQFLSNFETLKDRNTLMNLKLKKFQRITEAVIVDTCIPGINFAFFKVYM